MNENDVLMTTITIRRLMSTDGGEYMDVTTDPEVTVSEAVGMLMLSINEIMNDEE